jgi:hypothetical protein
MGRVSALLVLTSALVACSSSKATCTPGAQVTCACPGGAQGVQVCSADGQSLGTCQCAGATTGTGGSTSGSAGSTTTTGGGGSSSSGSAGGSGLGAPCDTTACPPSATQCAQVSGTGTFCTLSCGEGASPPAGGDGICLDAGATTGTPACVLTTPSDAGASVYFFSCGLLCGSMNGMEYGSCPSQLACMNNICS